MSDGLWLEAMVNIQQVHVGITVAVAMGVVHTERDGYGGERRLYGPEAILRSLRNKSQIMISDPDQVLNTGPGVQIGETARRWIGRGDYAQAVQLLGAQTVDIMRQVLTK